MYFANNMNGYGLRELTTAQIVRTPCVTYVLYTLHYRKMTLYPAFFICISSGADFPFKLAKAHSLEEEPAGHT
jgi:hypothetical protein